MMKIDMRLMQDEQMTAALQFRTWDHNLESWGPWQSVRQEKWFSVEGGDKYPDVGTFDVKNHVNGPALKMVERKSGKWIADGGFEINGVTHWRRSDWACT